MYFTQIDLQMSIPNLFFVCVEVLQPGQPNRVMSRLRVNHQSGDPQKRVIGKQCRHCHFTNARTDMLVAHFFSYECAKKLLSFAHFNCAIFNYFYR